MFVGKINSINFHNQRVSSFQGDTLNNNKSEKTETREISTKLLLGVLGASAAVMGTAYLLGSRAGRKHLVKNARRTVEEVNKLPDVPVAAPNPQKPILHDKFPVNSLAQQEFYKSFPSIPEFISEGVLSAYFSKMQLKISELPQIKQLSEFKKYLEFLKMFPPEKLENKILFTPGKFKNYHKFDMNIEVAKAAIDFAKENPKYQQAILSNLLDYEMQFKYHETFEKYGYIPKSGDNSIKKMLDSHMNNAITIRKMLTENGLKCNERLRLRARADWADTFYPPQTVTNSEGKEIALPRTRFHGPNNFKIGFQNHPDIKKYQKAALDYDIMHGIDDGLMEYINTPELADYVNSKKIFNLISGQS